AGPELPPGLPSLPTRRSSDRAPLAFGVKVTEQLAELPVPLSVQLAAEKVPPLFVKLTVPVGVVATPGVVSVTVAVQLVGLPTGTQPDARLTLVVVVGLGAVTTVVPALASRLASPT